ncbi:MAG: DUF6986 family protein [Alphaproteobacteria bacterium]
MIMTTPHAGDTDLDALQQKARISQEKLLRESERLVPNLPLKFWRQQAHFTTPATGTPEKAVRGLSAAARILDRYEISVDDLAAATGASNSTLKDVLSGSLHSPLVMVDAEDAVALDDESTVKAREGAIRCFTGEQWGPTLAFFRPAGLRLESCVDDLFTVLLAAGEGTAPELYPVDGIIWPKSEYPDEISWICDILSTIERRLGLTENQIRLEILVESGHALDQLGAMARTAAARLCGIIWGIADYSADINLPKIQNNHPICDWARHEIVNVSGAMQVPAIDCMTINYPTPVHRGGDLTPEQNSENRNGVLGALKDVYDDTCHAIDLGMEGKWVGHPAQLLMVLAAFRESMSTALVEQDVLDIEAYVESVAAGAGATIIGDSKRAYMADRATDRHLRGRLRKATAWGHLDADRAAAIGVISQDECLQIKGVTGAPRRPAEA